MTKSERAVCDHCMLEFNRNAGIEKEADGKTLCFCCHGCAGAYELINGSGLGSFYVKRSDWEAGPADTAKVSEDLFTDSLTETEDEYSLDVMLTGVRCASCIWLVETFLQKDPDVTYARVNYATHKAKIRWKKDTVSPAEIIDKLSSIGYPPLPVSRDEKNSVLERERKDYFYRFSIGAFFSMQVMLYTVAMYAGYFQGMDASLNVFFKILAFVLATPVMFYSGLPFVTNSLKALRNRNLNMDVLVFLGSFSAYAYSVSAVFTGHEVYFDTSSMIITLILLGRFIETGAKLKHAGAVSRLLSYQPKQVRLITGHVEGGTEVVLVPAEQIKAGDFLEVLPGASVPADGMVAEGLSEVDESMLTGESIPRTKEAGSEVFAGTANTNGRLVIECTAPAGDTVLSKIVKAVEEAQNERAPIQNAADRVVAYFVPVIISIAAASFAYWYVKTGSPLAGLINAVSVLVIACPCALGLATPLAIMVATTKTASFGALVRSGDVLETLSRIRCYCFDKTGTITKGEMKVAEVVSFGSGSVLDAAASVERYSSHLISKAVTKAYTGEFLQADNFAELPGNGVAADIAGKEVRVGKLKYIAEHAEVSVDMRNRYDELSASGATVIAVSEGRKVTGLISLADSIRPEAAETLRSLISSGKQVMMITGDSEKAAAGLAASLNVEGLSYMAEVTPFQKSEIVKQQKKTHKTAMVGDGINDAPALTEADAGIAMGRGTDIAIESADVVLIRNDLSVIGKLDRTAAKTFSVIRQNLFWAFSYNLVAVPLAVSGKIHPIFSAALMSVSSLIVVFNSLRIKR
jgi:heavy metal translocating P-type ATPase